MLKDGKVVKAGGKMSQFLIGKVLLEIAKEREDVTRRTVAEMSQFLIGKGEHISHATLHSLS